MISVVLFLCFFCGHCYRLGAALQLYSKLQETGTWHERISMTDECTDSLYALASRPEDDRVPMTVFRLSGFYS